MEAPGYVVTPKEHPDEGFGAGASDLQVHWHSILHYSHVIQYSTSFAITASNNPTSPFLSTRFVPSYINIDLQKRRMWTKTLKKQPILWQLNPQISDILTNPHQLWKCGEIVLLTPIISCCPQLW